MSEIPSTAAAVRDELRTVPLSAISVQEGFNPRRRFDERELDRLARTIAQTGLLQPLRVRPRQAPGEYELVDGERRYRAAFMAGLTEVPVCVRASGCHGDDGKLGEQDLLEAATANFHRAAHTPVEEALIFDRLRTGGLTQRGIAERLAVSRELVRERLAILELPEDLHELVDDGTIALGAVSALVALARIHARLPAVAVRRVTTPPAESWQEPLTWADVVEDPIAAVCSQYHDDEPDLPAGVFESRTQYPLSAFELGEQGDRELAALVKLNAAWATDDAHVSFDRELVEQAAALGAAHASKRGYATLIVGQEVADQLAADAVRAQLKAERARARREREQRKHAAEAAGQDIEVAAAGGPQAQALEQERRRAERHAEQQARAAAQAFNLELGAAVLKTFAKVRLDAPTVQVLAAVDFRDDLASLVARGARYGFPGWPQEQTTKAAKTKTVYLDGRDAALKACEFLAGASSAGEYAGRCLALVVMAVLADEACVARSSRSGFDFYGYKPAPWSPDHSDGALPWQRDVVALVEDLALERLPEHLTVRVRDAREHARRQAAERAAAEAAAHAAETELRARLDGMTPGERVEALAAFRAAHGAHGDRSWQLRALVEQLNSATTTDASPTGDNDHDEPDPPAGEHSVDAAIDIEDREHDVDPDDDELAQTPAA